MESPVLDPPGLSVKSKPKIIRRTTTLKQRNNTSLVIPEILPAIPEVDIPEGVSMNAKPIVRAKPKLLTRRKKELSAVSPSWYKIPEIKPKDFLFCVSRLYSAIKKEKESKSVEDIFLKAIVVNYNEITHEKWKELETPRLTQKGLEMKMGDFHEELMGKFPGYITYPTGHSSGCDVGSLDGTILIEVKNRDNTMNSSSAKSVIANLTKHANNGKTAILVEVICPNGKVNRFKAPDTVKVMNGKDAYDFFSGRKTFWNDLLLTLTHVFKTYKSYDELKRILETA